MRSTSRTRCTKNMSALCPNHKIRLFTPHPWWGSIHGANFGILVRYNILIQPIPETKPINILYRDRPLSRTYWQGCNGKAGVYSPPLPSLPLPSPTIIFHWSRPPKIQLGGLGSVVSSLAGSGAEPQPTNDLVHFGFKIWHLVVTILIIFLSTMLFF